MNHAYLTKKDIDVARVVRQITMTENKELDKKLETCKKYRVIKNVILHDVA